jgi:hypothetical protein
MLDPSVESKEKMATFTLHIPNFNELCKKKEKMAFSDLTHIGGLPWQVFAMAEHNHLNTETGEVLPITPTSPFSHDSHLGKSLSIYLSCNGTMGEREFVFGKTSSAFVLVPNTAKDGQDIVHNFAAKFNETDYLTKINLGKLEVGVLNNLFFLLPRWWSEKVFQLPKSINYSNSWPEALFKWTALCKSL